MLIDDLGQRKLKVEVGLYGRLDSARRTLHLLHEALQTSALEPVVKLPGEVTVALHDAYIELS
jgi:hypothetical protein